jgi:hypothetical protein
MSKLVIATPVRGGEIDAAQVSFGWAAQMRALSIVFNCDLPIVGYNYDVVRSRNRMAAQVLRDKGDVEYVLWWDDDVMLGDLKIVREMMATGEDVIAAPYANKLPPIGWVHTHFKPPREKRGLLQEVRSVGFGFTMTSTKCLRAMSEPARKYTDWTRNGDHYKVADIFGLTFEAPEPGGSPEDEMLMSEDYSFCKRWRDMGGKIQIYLGAGILGHAGGHAFNAKDIPGGVL